MNEELRDALARNFAPTHWPILLERHRDRLRARADAVLALPEVAALLADAERVRRVRELHRPYERWADTVWTNVRETACAECLTLFPCQTIRALDGDPS